MGQGGVNRAFHRERFYPALFHADEDFGREADEPVFQPEFVQGV